MIDMKLAVKKVKTQQDFKGVFKYWNKLCNFLAVLRAIELELDTLFSIQETVDGINDLIALHMLSEKGGLPKGDSYVWMGRYFGKLRGNELVGYQIGFIRDGKPIGWKGGVPEYQFVQLKWKTGRGNQHWTLGDKDGNEIYDAWDPSNDPEFEKVSLDKKYLLQFRSLR